MAERVVEDLPEDFDPQPKKRFRPGFFTYLAIVLFSLVVLLGGAYSTWYFSAAAALEEQREEIIARGEPYWFADLKPKEPLPPEEDGTEFLYRAIETYQTPSMDFGEVLDGMAGGGESNGRPTPRDYPELRQALKDNRQTLKLLGQAIDRGRVRLKRDYGDAYIVSIVPDEASMMREMARLLRADVIQALGQADTPRAVTAVQQMLGLCRLLEDEPVLVSQLIRLAILSVALDHL